MLHSSFMDDFRGVLTLAFGGAAYVRMAVDMARAIRLRDATTPLAVVTDLDAALFCGMFEHVVQWKHDYASYYECKFDLGAMSPFDETLFIDSDCMVLRPLSKIFELFVGHDFSVAGQNVKTPWWFRAPEKIRAHLLRDFYPGFNGGLFYFRRSARATAVFDRARSLVVQYDALGLDRLPGGAINDEPLFSLAMAEMGCSAVENARHEIMYGPRLQPFEVDVLTGRCTMERNGRMVQPMICHFEGADKKRYAYVRECVRVAARTRLGTLPRWLEPVVRAYAFAVWLIQRTAVRVGRLRKKKTWQI